MPRRYTARPRRTKRPTRRYRRRSNKVPSLWSRSKLIKVTMVNTSAYDALNGAMGGVAWKANSLNDPSGIAGTGLPLGIDEWSHLYKKYTIVKSILTVVGHPVTITGAGITGIHLTDQSALLTDLDHYKELPLTTSKMISPDIDIFKNSMVYKPKVFWRIKDLRDNAEQKASLIGGGSAGNPQPADPTNLAYFHVWLQDANKTQTLTEEVSVRATYFILLTDPVTPTRSEL